MSMRAETIEGKALNYVLVLPDDYREDAAYPLVVFLHGFGANMYDLMGVSPAIGERGYVYAFPNAPFVMDFGGGQFGFSWSLNAPGAPPVQSDGPSTEDLLEGFLAEVRGKTRAEPGRVLIGGFSQGGGLALRYALPRPDLFAGIAVLSGAFRDSQDFRGRLPPRRDQPLFVAHGTMDPMVPIDRGRATRSVLEELGYAPAYREYEMAHEISEEELYDLADWVKEVLPPAG